MTEKSIFQEHIEKVVYGDTLRKLPIKDLQQQLKKRGERGFVNHPLLIKEGDALKNSKLVGVIKTPSFLKRKGFWHKFYTSFAFARINLFRRI